MQAECAHRGRTERNNNKRKDMANKPTDQELRQQNVAEAVSKTELFFQKNSKLIYG